MRKVQNCVVENCIPTPSSCVEWNGGDIKFLDICNGESLNNVVWEIVTKLEDIAGEDISQFDIDDMLDICNQKRPLEITLINILTLLKNNDVCLKDYITTLQEQISELAKVGNVTVNLKCFADFDNIGNSLTITREQLDQLVIDKLCSHEQHLVVLDGNIINLQNQINELNADKTVEELNFGTCINSSILPTSTQVINTSQALCELRDTTGLPIALAAAVAKYPSNWNVKFQSLPGFIINPENAAQIISDLLLVVKQLEDRVTVIENTCCGPTCDKIELGIQFIINDDDTVDLFFSSGSGTFIPNGFEDCGSTITFIDGNGAEFSPSIFNTPITQEGTIAGINIANLATGVVKVNINAKFCLSDETGAVILTCQKCINTEFVNTAGCCVITNTASEANTIIYKTTIVL